MQKPRTPSVGTLLCEFIFLVAGLLVGVGGCQSAPEHHVFSTPPGCPPEIERTDDPHTHRLLPGEEITFRFPEGTNYTARVLEDGTVNLPLVGNVKAAGKTPYELLLDVSKLYVPRFYERWTIPYLPEQRVYSVGGHVRSPGRQVYLGSTTVTKAIQSAGDFTDFAAKHRVELIRANGQKIDVNCIKAAKDPTLDLPVYPGDRIPVPQRTWLDVFR
jgi:protein involved in polysaccharide export with SLBB domain